MTLATDWRLGRLAVSNAGMRLFVPDTHLSLMHNRVMVNWTSLLTKKPIARPWQTRSGESFYPVWWGKWGHGGTCCTALSQLVRWIRGQPVLPMCSWEWWCSPTVLLARAKGDELLRVLRDGCYPEHANCVLCGGQVTRLDWWCLDGVSGPCCGWTSGCRQEGIKA